MIFFEYYFASPDLVVAQRERERKREREVQEQ